MSIYVNCNNVDYSNPGNYCKQYDVALTGDNKKDCTNRLKFGVCQSKVSDCIDSKNAKMTQQYNIDLENARNARDNARKIQAAWDTTYNFKKQLLQQEKKVWNNCVGWPWVFGHDDWCQNDTGFGRQVGAGQWGCTAGMGKGQCARTDWQVEQELTKSGPRPGDGPKDPTQPSPYKRLNLAAITCCNNIVNIVNGEITNSKITQQCISKTDGDTKLDKDNKGSNMTTTTSTSKPMSYTDEISDSKQSNIPQITAALFVLIIFISSISIIIAILLLLF
jgi:hypothetical protein